MKKGLNAISIASLHPDHFATDEVQQDITQQLIKKKIHIAIIQETHIPRNLSYEKKNGYRIITSAAIKNPKTTPEHDIPGKHIAGVAIAIQTEMAPHISTISRINHRILKITLDHPKTHTPITILATYAPHSGHTNHERSNHWGAVSQTIKDIPRHHMAIWGEDANGQLGREKNRPGKYNKIIGNYTNHESPD